MAHVGRPAVLHLISSLCIGGAERLLVDLAVALSETADRPHVFVVMNAGYDLRLVAQLRESGFPVILLDRPQGHRHPKYLKQLIDIVRTRHVGVIHAHNRGSRMWAAAVRLLRPGIRVTATIHNTGIVPAMGAFDRSVHRASVDVTIAISKAVEMECRAGGFVGVEAIDNGIDLRRFRAVRERRLLAGKAPRLLCIGRYLPEQKGQDVLIEALAILRRKGQDFVCHFAGVRSEETRSHLNQLEAMVRQRDLAGHITFVHDRIDTPRLLSDADIFVLPSRFEGFGLVVVEAMAAGVPVIASRVGGPKTLIDNGKTGLLVPSDDPAALADAISDLIENPNSANILARNAETAAEKFSIERMRDRYLAVYDRLSTPSELGSAVPA